MALLYRAVLRPTKLELLSAWIPTRPWYQGPTAPEIRAGVSFRFDDPAGEVGIETLLVHVGDGPLVQAPLTYRDAPLDGHEQWLLGTTEHSVLGRRWVYDAVGDPVYAQALANAILTGGSQAEEFVDVDGGLQRRDPAASVRGGGAQDADVPSIKAVIRVDQDDPTLVVTDSLELAVRRILDGSHDAGPAVDDRFTLTGTWNGQAAPMLLAYGGVS
jgi:hypothetical protein